jgi:hypothetical protein
MVWRNLVIDFRYHVVSLTAVFLALAVGVVLGSGPLRTALVSELTNETDELRDALATSKAETDDAIREGEIGEAFLDEASATLIGGSLTGHNVAIIRMLEPDGGEVQALRVRLEGGGAQVTANLSIQPGWTDDGQTAFRAAFASQVVDSVVGVDATVAPDRVLAHALAQALVPTEYPEGTAPTDGGSAATVSGDRSAVLLDLLRTAELVDGTVTGSVDTVVFVIGSGPNSDDELAMLSDTYSEIVGVMDEYVAGTVVATGPPRGGDVISVINISTVLRDNVTTVVEGLNYYGNFTVVLALAKEAAGTVGHYGYGDNLDLYPGR